MKKTKIVFIDADPIRYRVGFAGESISYEAVLEDESGHMHRFFFEPHNEQSAYDRLKKFMSEHPDWELLDKIKSVDVAPWYEVEQMLQMQIDSIKKEVREHYGLDRRDVDYVLILSGSGNYRNKIATLKEYKGNRDPTHKPHHFGMLTDALRTRHGAIVVQANREADDEISIRAWDMRRAGRGDEYVIATIDKDLDQIPGDHYDYMKKVFYEVSVWDARGWFWQQALSGDPTDNIGGACQIGPKKAAQFLEAAWAAQDDDEALWEQIVDIYAKQSEVPGCYHAAVSPAQAALENARLVYLQQREGELWTPPGAPKEFISEDE